jgi:FkbM family methyltransferase
MHCSNPDSFLERSSRFIRKPFKAKVESLRYHAGRLHDKLLKDRFVTLVRLPGGPLALAWPDVLGSRFKRGDYERNEWLVVQNFLRPGMTVLDVGAHHGYYSLLAAPILKNAGCIVAFEPSSRERRKLRWNLMLNGFRFVKVEPVALGSEEGSSDFFIVRGKETGCNSMRPPDVDEPVVKKCVQVLTLDHYLASQNIKSVDFLKLDVEGAELSVLKGAKKLLATKPRPVILCEVDEIRSAPWNYRAVEIYDFLVNAGFEWFSCKSDGLLAPFPRKEEFHSNLVAIPAERRSTILS